MKDEVGPKFLANVLKCDVRGLKNFVDEGMPKAQRGRYSLAACVPWYVEYKVQAARAGKGLNDLDLARQRKTIAEAQEAELRVAKALGELIDADTHKEIVGQLCSRLMAILQNIPSNYGLRLENAGVPSDRSEALLEAIANEMTSELRTTADQLDAEAARDEEEVETSGDRAAAAAS